jgi:hypothetical protein
MRTFSELTPEQLTQIKDNADKLLSEKYRSYLPGRMLAMLLSRYRDDVAEALGQESPELPRRDGQVRQVTLDELTTVELHEFTHVVLVLLTYDRTMDDPALPQLLREFRESLVKQKRERDEIEQDHYQTSLAWS